MSVTPVPELEKLLDAAEATGRMNGPEWDAYGDATDSDTIRALVNVAKAAWKRYESGGDAALDAALALLFPEEAWRQSG